MKDYLASIEKLRTEAAEAALVRDLATDSIKREMYSRIHDHLTRLADEVELALTKSGTATAPNGNGQPINPSKTTSANSGVGLG